METDLGPEGDVDRPYGRISLKQESEPLSESGREKAWPFLTSRLVREALGWSEEMEGEEGVRG